MASPVLRRAALSKIDRRISTCTGRVLFICSQSTIQCTGNQIRCSNQAQGRAIISTRQKHTAINRRTPETVKEKNEKGANRATEAWNQYADGSHPSLHRPERLQKYSALQVEDRRVTGEGIIRIIKLAELDTMNALSTRLLEEFRKQVDDLSSEQAPHPTVRAVVIASEHDKAFCAGANLKERANMTASETRQFLSHLRQAFMKLSGLKIPTISAVHGYALGGGLELALCTHLRVFSKDAVVGMPEVGLGIIPGAGGTFRLPALVGRSRALDLMLTARRLGAEEAKSWGLCDRVVEHASEADLTTRRLETLRVAVTLASKISLGAPLAAQAIVKAAHVDGTQEKEKEAYEDIIETEDRQEALAAFVEKRKPVFKGE